MPSHLLTQELPQRGEPCSVNAVGQTVLIRKKRTDQFVRPFVLVLHL